MFRFKKSAVPRKESIGGALTPPTYDGALYSHVQGQVITPGAEVYAFVQRFNKPQYDLIGAGFHTGQFEPYAGPQVYVNLNVPNNGIGGLQAGQMAQLGLVNNDFSPVE